MRRALSLCLLLLALGAGSCSKPTAREYPNNDLQLATGHTAKEMCSCLFVLEQSEEFCNAWTRADPAITSFRIDRSARTVEAAALLMWSARAHYVDDHFGCTLE